MATNKKRINVTLDSELEFLIENLAKRDQMSQSSKAVQLIRMAIELDEDEVLNQLAERRDLEKAKFVDHDQAWK
jgi:hypothetical protein